MIEALGLDSVASSERRLAPRLGGSVRETDLRLIPRGCHDAKPTQIRGGHLHDVQPVAVLELDRLVGSAPDPAGNAVQEDLIRQVHGRQIGMPCFECRAHRKHRDFPVGDM